MEPWEKESAVSEEVDQKIYDGLPEFTDSAMEDTPKEEVMFEEVLPSAQKPSARTAQFGVFSTQTTICVLVVVILLFLKLLAGGTFASILSHYKAVAQQDIQFNQKIEDAKQAISKYIQGLKPLDRNSSSETSSNQESSSQSGSQSNESSSSQTESESSSSSVPSDATVSEISYPGEIQEPVSGKITSYFGIRKDPSGKSGDFHKGIDIAAPKGTPISAAISGQVQTADHSDSYGNYVLLEHSNQFTTLYAHCDKVKVKEGENVQQGKTIATVGTTGDSTGYHLHFGIAQNGIWCDPLNSLPENNNDYL